jgi:hypothetical protein
MTTDLIQAPLPGLDIDNLGARPVDLTLVDPDRIVDACALIRVHDNTARWVLGDLVLALAHTVGDAEAIRRISAQGHDQPTLARSVRVSAKIPHHLRWDTLTWSHHAEVHDLPSDDITGWLDRADTNAWTVRQLRAAIQVERDAQAPALPDMGRLPRPPETPLRQALAGHPETPVLWVPADGNLAAATVRHVEQKGDHLVVVVEVPTSMATALGGLDERGAA